MKKFSKTAIDWPNLDYTLHPQVGCRRNCSYCVIRNRVWPRVRQFYGNNDFNVVTELPEQLDRLHTVKKPSTFFVGFYTDIEYCSVKYMNHILDTLEKYPQRTRDSSGLTTLGRESP
jgi:DNA repair photolyase